MPHRYNPGPAFKRVKSELASHLRKSTSGQVFNHYTETAQDDLVLSPKEFVQVYGMGVQVKMV